MALLAKLIWTNCLWTACHVSTFNKHLRVEQNMLGCVLLFTNSAKRKGWILNVYLIINNRFMKSPCSTKLLRISWPTWNSSWVSNQACSIEWFIIKNWRLRYILESVSQTLTNLQPTLLRPIASPSIARVTKQLFISTYVGGNSHLHERHIIHEKNAPHVQLNMNQAPRH